MRVMVRCISSVRALGFAVGREGFLGISCGFGWCAGREHGLTLSGMFGLMRGGGNSE